LKLELVSVSYRYPGQQEYALKEVNAVFEGGKTYLITGPNGAGKTTLLLVAAGLLKPEEGYVTLDGIRLDEHTRDLRRFFGVLFQNPDVMLFNPTVYDEITYSIKQIEKNEGLIAQKVEELLKFFELNKDILTKPVYTLSYGFKKIIALISILIYDPKILLLDEPHTNLSKKFVKKVAEVIQTKKECGGITIVSSHNRRVYEGLTDCVIYIVNGRIVKKTCK